ncbi:MAG: heme-binding domain-containing protein [Saprospiraceae bacterium]|nr:heme-binding domain-containing protein [Saprospiraceae bacterium]
MNKIVKKVLVGLLIVLILIQFIRIDKANPSADPAQDIITILQPPEELADLMKVSCYDCHSYHTSYPWYTNIAPFSFWIKQHINEGRHHLNFSEWGTYTDKRAHHKLEECYEEVLEGHMPLPSYTWMHADAKLSDEERKALAGWFQDQMSNYNPQ